MRDTITDALAQLATLRAELNARFIERDAVILGALAALVSGEHVLLLGPVGTAKSMLAVELCKRVEDARYFGWLLTRFSTPEELFGPISLKALEDDRYQRLTEGRLPTAHIAFLDEIFKANSAILNALLSLVNERVYHNGTRAIEAPLMTLMAASNELPEEGELVALFDRFALRYTVGYIQEDFRFLKLLAQSDRPSDAQDTARLSLDAVRALQAHLPDVTLHDGFLGDLVDLRRRLRDKGIVASDRRWRKAVTLLRAFALVQGRHAVVQDDMLQLQHVLWSEPDQRTEILATLREVFYGHDDEARKLLAQAREVRDYALRGWDDASEAMRASIEAHTKLKRIHRAADQLLTQTRERGRATGTVQDVITRIEAIQAHLLKHGP